MANKEYMQATIQKLCDEQRYGVLSTCGSEGPYASLVAFCHAPDCARFFFATARSTRKFANLQAQPRIAFLVDNRENKNADAFSALGLTVTGTARELSGEERASAERKYLKRHPHLEDFVRAENVAMIAIDAKTHYIVSRFQEVFELDAR